MERVAAVTGSEKSPPGGDTAPTIVTVPLKVVIKEVEVVITIQYKTKQFNKIQYNTIILTYQTGHTALQYITLQNITL